MRYIAGIKNHAVKSSRNLAGPFGDFVAVGDVAGGLPVGGKVFLEKRARFGRIFSLELRRLFNQLTLFPLVEAGSAERFVLEQVDTPIEALSITPLISSPFLITTSLSFPPVPCDHFDVRT